MLIGRFCDVNVSSKILCFTVSDNNCKSFVGAYRGLARQKLMICMVGDSRNVAHIDRCLQAVVRSVATSTVTMTITQAVIPGGDAHDG